MPYLHVKIVGKELTEYKSKKEAKISIIEMVQEVGKSFGKTGYSYFRVNVKRNKKIVAIIKFNRSSEAEHCKANLNNHDLIKAWKGELSAECIQRPRPIFIPTFRKLSKGTPFKDRDKLTQNAAAIIKRNALRRQIKGSMIMKCPFERQVIRGKRWYSRQKKMTNTANS